MHFSLPLDSGNSHNLQVIYHSFCNVIILMIYEKYVENAYLHYKIEI